MSFNKLSVKGLKLLIAKYKKEHMPLVRYSKMKKPELVALLESKFYIKEGKMYLKQNVSTKTVNSDNHPMQFTGTVGQKTFQDAIKRIEMQSRAKANYSKDQEMAERIRG